MFIYNATEGDEGLGAGFLVDRSGVIITNWHVTNKADEVFVWVLPDDGPVSIEQMFKNMEPRKNRDFFDFFLQNFPKIVNFSKKVSRRSSKFNNNK